MIPSKVVNNDDESEPLAKLKAVREAKKAEATEVNDFGPSKPAISINEDAYLFNSSDILHHSKVTSAIEDKLKKVRVLLKILGMFWEGRPLT